MGEHQAAALAREEKRKAVAAAVAEALRKRARDEATLSVPVSVHPHVMENRMHLNGKLLVDCAKAHPVLEAHGLSLFVVAYKGNG